MTQTKQQLIARQREINDQLSALGEGAAKRELTADEQAQEAKLMREFKNNEREISLMNQQEQSAQLAQQRERKTANQIIRDAIKAVRERKSDGSYDLQLRSNSQNAVSSSVIAANDTNNIDSAQLPIFIDDLMQPMEAELIYNKMGLKVVTGVHGKIVWPYLDNAVEATVGGETDAVSEATLDFSKLSPTPVKIGLAIPVTNEAINDAAFDLQALVIEQLGKSVARVLNKRVIALSAPAAKADFVGPLKAIATATGSTGLATHKVTFAAALPTYAEIAKMENVVFSTNAQRSGAGFIMTPAMWNNLRHTFVANSEGKTLAEGTIDAPTCDGYPVFLTDSAEYTNKIAFGYFGYEALLQHGQVNLVIDPYTQAKKNETLFVINADWSLTNLAKDNNHYPFAVGICTTA